MDYVLKNPVTLGERTLYEIHTHEPTLNDLCAVGVTPVGSAVADRKLLASLTGESELLIGKITAKDWSCIAPKMSEIWNEYFKSDEEGERPQGEAMAGIVPPEN